MCGSMAAHPYRLAVELHNAAYRELGLDYTFVYFGITDPRAGIEAIRTLGIRGMNVSMPFKAAVIPYLDRLDPAAQAIGAVNTIDNRDGVLTGYNTDYIGAVKALEDLTSLAGTRIALFGAGGVARAVSYGLVEKGGRVTVFNRSVEPARQMADEFSLTLGGPLEDFPGCEGFDILINCTALGFRSADESPVEQVALNRDTIVMDVVFLPSDTKLLRSAEAAGCKTVQGVKMLLYQACGQVELYTGCTPPVAVMEQVIEREVRNLR